MTPLLVGAVALALGALPGPGRAALSAEPAWTRYVLGPASSTVEPVRIAARSGPVTNAEALVDGGTGAATLTMSEGGPAPVIVLDYGKDVGGIPAIDVEAVKGSPTLRASFSESGRFIDADGDNGGMGPCCGIAPPAAEPRRWNEWTPAAPGVLRTAYLQGGERFVRIALTAPGTVRLRSVAIDFTPFRALPADYQGWFLSDDDLLNRIFYAGAYTLQLDMVPPGTQNGNPEPAVVDGAKRDRAIWSGDLVVEGPGIWTTLGTGGAAYVKQSLLALARAADASGGLPGPTFVHPSGGLVFSEAYSMHAADAMVDYFRYTGDRDFARQVLPVVEKQLAFIASRVDDRGLLVSRAGTGPGLCCGLDWDVYDGPKTGAVTAYNVIYHHALREAAYLETHVGDAARAADDESRAAALRDAINATLFDASRGVYRLSDERPQSVAQDASALAVLYGVAPEERVTDILTSLEETLWTPYGTRPFSADTGFSPVISPFVTGLETAARFGAGDDAGALELIRRLWGIMVRTGIDDTGALWEKMSPTGTVEVLTGTDPVDNQSLAHGWSTAPTTQMLELVLGAAPVDPGYETWVVAPHLGDLRRAQGQVPTPFGPLRLSWSQSAQGTRLQGVVSAPAGTRGQILLPAPDAGTRVTFDGRPLPAGEPIALVGDDRPHTIAMTGGRLSCRRLPRGAASPDGAGTAGCVLLRRSSALGR